MLHCLSFLFVNIIFFTDSSLVLQSDGVGNGTVHQSQMNTLQDLSPCVITSVKGQFDDVSTSDTSFKISDNGNDSGIHEPEEEATERERQQEVEWQRQQH